MTVKLHGPKFYCELSGISLDHLLKFIYSGELRASNVASPTSKRKRWLISEDDWESFLARRATREGDTPITAADSPRRKPSHREFV